MSNDQEKGSTGTLDLSHPEVKALTDAGIDATRLEQLVSGKSIDHEAVKGSKSATAEPPEVVEQAAPAEPAPTLDTQDLDTALEEPAAFNQQLQQTAADTLPVPQTPVPAPTNQPMPPGAQQMIAQLTGQQNG